MAKTTTKEIRLQPISLSKIKVPIAGMTPLLMDKFPDEAKEEILAKQSGIAKGNKKKVRDMSDEVKNAIHWIDKKNIGFPAEGFKAGMMVSTSFVGDRMFSKVLVQGSIRITNGINGLIPIKYKKQDVMEHFIKPNTKFSPQFHDWSCELEIAFDSNNITAQDIVTLLNYSGFYVGIGAWRPRGGGGGSGEYGTYQVDVKKLKM